MNKLVIAVDMDGIVTDLLQKWLIAINERFNRKLTVPDVTNWDIGKLDQTKDISGKVYKMIQEPMFFWDLDPLPGSQDALRALKSDGHEVHFLTAPAGADSAKEKILWVNKHFSFIPEFNITQTHFKEKFTADVFIDDKGKGLELYHAAHPDALVLTFEYPYNAYLKDHPAIKTVGRWDDTKAAWANALAEIEKKANGNQSEKGTASTSGLPNCS